MARRRRSKVQRIVNLFKKFLTFIFSNVGLFLIVVSFALLGSVTFRAIEAPHELKQQRIVQGSRMRAVNFLWNNTYKLNVLNKQLWEQEARRQVVGFKTTVMDAVRQGYDGKEFKEAAQWTFTGAFLYSLTVITTIGYGNIACRTYFGKTVTIMYALIGIPLMLLFLTNTGDVMAKSFKFLYSYSLKLRMRFTIWRRRRKQAQQRYRVGGHHHGGRGGGIEAASMVSSRSRSSGRSAAAAAANHRSNYQHYNSSSRQQSDEPPDPRGGAVAIAAGGGSLPSRTGGGGRQIIRRELSQESFPDGPGDIDELLSARAELEQLSLKESMEEKLSTKTSVSSCGRIELLYKAKIEALRKPTPTYVFSLKEPLSVTVPLTLVLVVMTGYLVLGSILFTIWEGWGFIDAFYFCYISLSTIGFGDLFPGSSVDDSDAAQEKLVITSLYLLLGMALIAMCFNLAQEEVVNKVTNIATKLGVLKSGDEYD